MKAFLYKELKLALPLPIFLFTLFGIMTMIPSYPIFVGLFYSLIAVFVMYSVHKDNRDIEFSLTLPVTRDVIVKSKVIVIMLMQIACMFFSAIGSVLANFALSPNGNIVGSDPNIAFFGMGFIAFSVFNLIFIPWFYKTGYKLNLPIFISILAFVICFGIYEMLSAVVPSIHTVFDTLDPQYFGYQSIFLVIGIILYFSTLLISCKLAVKNFEKVNI